ncbi:hypothetical protein GCM10017667_42420 [Streptomyces filamentosus]|uniref:Uncharacterized protein n=1 Tax=Streptomyces filamentosus TaxID=67294 RepID=A0A919EQ77_STRFL|nr:hypothetical protein GCM10017667_42420 [Streptomyces filamentosus]
MALQEPGDLLSEGLPSAVPDRTDQPSYPHPDHDLPAVDRHIPHRPAVIPVNPSHQHPAQRTGNGNMPVRAETWTVSPPSTTSSMANADNPENTVPTNAFASCTLDDHR